MRFALHNIPSGFQIIFHTSTCIQNIFILLISIIKFKVQHLFYNITTFQDTNNIIYQYISNNKTIYGFVMHRSVLLNVNF